MSDDPPSGAEVQVERGRRIARAHGVWVGTAGCAGQVGTACPEAAGRSFVL